MSTIRESMTLDPITTERLDTMGNIHRYNFGWVKTHKIVGGGIPDGTILDTCSTGISGVASLFNESTGQEILPPALETPSIDAKTSMVGEIKLTSFFKFGTKMRSMVRTRAIGLSEVVVMGQQGYAIDEKKAYADAVGEDHIYTPQVPSIEAAEGGVTITVANGVKTKTTIKG